LEAAHDIAPAKTNTDRTDIANWHAGWGRLCSGFPISKKHVDLRGKSVAICSSAQISDGDSYRNHLLPTFAQQYWEVQITIAQ
jgi:hypothetical protein